MPGRARPVRESRNGWRNAEKSLGWGEGTTDEMCVAFLRVTVDAERLGVRSR